MANNPNIGFSLFKINTEQFAIIEDGFNDKGQIQLGTNLRYAADETNKIIAVFSSFAFESDQKPFLIIEASCHFRITEESWSLLLNKDLNLLEVPKGFITHLALLTVGTTRGILHSKTDGSCFNKYILPTINLIDIIKDDVTFSFNQQVVENK